MVLRSTGMPPCQLKIKINDNHITRVPRHRHLGVTFNERLSWKDHVHDVINKSAKKIGLPRRLGRQLSSTNVRDLYAFSIRPGIEYGTIRPRCLCFNRGESVAVQVYGSFTTEDPLRKSHCDRFVHIDSEPLVGSPG